MKINWKQKLSATSTYYFYQDDVQGPYLLLFLVISYSDICHEKMGI